ncbi:hypothetical protein L7F22_060929 [Adiantum nelumboides]|nr:hypothetical protein [Adiantum nelumboides]
MAAGGGDDTTTSYEYDTRTTSDEGHTDIEEEDSDEELLKIDADLFGTSTVTSLDEQGGVSRGANYEPLDRVRKKEDLLRHKQDVLNVVKKDSDKEKLPRNIPNVSSALFFKYNTALGPPYQVLVDTNFINFSIQNKLDLEKSMMDCLYAKCTPCITDCVMAELEKLGEKYRVALRIAKDPRFEQLPCTHKGTYADDCIVDRVTQHKCYIVATCDRDLKRRIRKIPGVPIMYITQHRYSIERLPEATIGGAPRV